MNDLDKISVICDHIDIGSNEIITKTSINRNLYKLLSNDINLSENSEDLYKNLKRLAPFVEKHVYNKGDLVLFLDETHTHEGFVDDKIIINNLYLLRSLQDNNTSIPKKYLVESVPTFDDSGWHNENSFGSVFYNDNLLSTFVHIYLKDQTYELHSLNPKYHKHGVLSTLNDVQTKVLSVSMTNGMPERARIPFPTFCGQLHTEGNIINGFYKKWDTGLLEYNITYKLGDTSTYKHLLTQNNNVEEFKVLSSNSVFIQDNHMLSDDNYNENNRYFLNKDDFSIFQIPNNNKITYVNKIRQANLNPYINVFTGTINFPIKFRDLNYMVFNSNTAANRYGKSIINPNVNTITYVNKTVKSITAILVLNSFDNTDDPVGLSKNEFQCQIIGRWK